MGGQEIQPQATQHEAEKNSLASYTVIGHRGYQLPKEYEALVYSRWLRSLRFGNDFFKLIDQEAYYNTYNKFITRILEQPDCMARFATLSDDIDVVLGFSICRGNILDYVHVHKDQRRLGIGSKLVPHYVDTFTHITRTGMTIWGSKHGSWRFNPFA